MKLKSITSICLTVSLTIFSGCSNSNTPSNPQISESNNTNPPLNPDPKVPESNNTTTLLAENEPYYKYAWHIKSKNNILKTMGYAIDDNADINITKAWEITKGSNIKVAIIDDSFDVEHEDLKANIITTYDADNNTNDVTNKKPLGSTDEEGYPNDGSHGNTCAGFIVAPVNGKGIVGISPEAKLIAIRQNENSDAKTIAAFEYAKNQGAKVISCSWGTENVSQAVVDTLKSLYDANITILFASGNDTKSLDAPDINDESEVPWVIGVSASGENNDVTSYSNYGKNIDVIAPGGNVDVIGILGIDDTGERGDQNQQSLVSNNYAFTNGTSFSTPITAGVAALMYSINPNITPKQVKNILIQTTEKVGGTNADYNSSGFDEKRAYGKINAGKAVFEAKKL